MKGLTIARDGYRIELRSGVVHLLAPVGGDTSGAVFIGEGIYQLSPATAAERRHLSLVTGNDRLEVLTDRGGRRYRISGTITQAGVTEGFRTPVPIYLDLGDDRIERLGLLPLSGPVTQRVSVEIELPQRPRLALINARHDVLSR